MGHGSLSPSRSSLPLDAGQIWPRQLHGESGNARRGNVLASSYVTHLVVSGPTSRSNVVREASEMASERSGKLIITAVAIVVLIIGLTIGWFWYSRYREVFGLPMRVRSQQAPSQ